MNTLLDIKNDLPVNDYCKFITDKQGREFYEVLGRKFQLDNKIDYVLPVLYKIQHAYGKRAQAAKNNNGIDWKAISHALRAGYQAKHIYKESGFTYPLPETDYLMKVKMGELDYMSRIQPVLEALVEEVSDLAEQSAYPDSVNMKKVNNMIETVHNQIVNEG